MTNSTKRIFALSSVFAAMLPAMQANAAAFQVSEHSAAGLGRAFAGEAAIAEDASVVARNAAAMSFIDSPMFTGAVSYIKPEVEVERASGSIKNTGVANEAIVPAMYYVAPIDDKFTFGAGAFTNFGFTTDYTDSFADAGIPDLSEVITFNLNASLSYKILENLSVGFGANAVYAEGQLTSSGSAPGSAMDVSGDDWGYGWNAGIFWEPVEGTRLGASYRSEVDLTLEGEAKSIDFAGQLPIIPNWNGDASLDVTLPSIAELSVWQRVNDRLAVHASYMQIGWSSLDQIQVEIAGLPAAGNPDPEVQDYKDTSRWAVGATYNLNKAWTLRAGYAYDESPSNDEHRSFRIPDSDRQWYTFGANYKMSDKQSIDMGYAFLSADKVVIHETQGEVTKGDAHIFSVQYNHVF